MTAAIEPLPWIVGIGVITRLHWSATVVVNVTERPEARVSGGSSASWSATPAALTVNVHVSPSA